jgi:DNA-directed RNA polymerase I, II, and III subunit RPABC2
LLLLFDFPYSENPLFNKTSFTIDIPPLLTKFERARIIGVRLQQLAYGAKPRVNVENLKSINEIVEKELLERKIPFIIRRSLPNGTFEDWKLEEFEYV